MLLKPEPLDRETFGDFGDVIDRRGGESFFINAGSCIRFNDLATVDVLEQAGRLLVSLFVTKPTALPLTIKMLERHPLSSQAFMPLEQGSFLSVVAPAGKAPELDQIRAFYSQGQQGVNYRRGIWHHPLIALGRETTFLVLDRGADDKNCDIHSFEGETDILTVRAQED